MRRPRQTKGHDRHQALAAGKDPSVFRGNLGERIECFFDRLGCVIAEPRGLHRCSPRGTVDVTERSPHCPTSGNLIFWIEAQLVVYVKKSRPTEPLPSHE